MARNSNSGQKFISRNRKPRVHITSKTPMTPRSSSNFRL